ncbi:MAG: amidohydrolase [Deltaproteobacteria bacterium]|nr:amidohydrolase [Deltaproteobacteria bacterium]
MDNLHGHVKEKKDLIIQTRRDLHRIPETAFTEAKTARYLAEKLGGLDLEVETGIASHGLVALMKTGRPGPTLLFRADMDALPITESTGLSFTSTHDGIMHACGHDAHMAMVLGTAAVLNDMRGRLCGNIKFLFQPAEEGPGGAKPMIDAGVLKNPSVDYVFGCHVWSEIPEGTVGVVSGPFMAAMDRFDIRILGKGGHGAMPHECVDALEVGTQVVNALQRIVSRRSDPLKPTVVTVGTFHAGTAFNVIPAVAELSGTTRTFDPDVWKRWESDLRQIISGVCASMGAGFELNYTQGYPVTINDAGMAAMVKKCAAGVVGQERTVTPKKTMGGEDFSFFLQKAKGCYFALGAGHAGGASVHNPEFDFDEDILLIGTETFCSIALRILSRNE